MDSNGEELCEKCQGQCNKEHYIVIKDMCPYCNGNGIRDWIEKARGDWGYTNHRLFENLTLYNIELLTRELSEQYRKMGMEVSIEIHPRKVHERNLNPHKNAWYDVKDISI